MSAYRTDRGLQGALDEALQVVRIYSRDGTPIGRVSRSRQIVVGSGSVLEAEVSFEDYAAGAVVRRGQLVAVVSPVARAVIVGIVENVARADLLALLGIGEVRAAEDPASMVTPLAISIRPLAEMRYADDDPSRLEGPWPPSSPVDPQSPLFRPKAELVAEALNLPEDGVVVGRLLEGFKPSDVYVRFDERTFTHHVIVVGTTGAGKTTLLKRIVWDPSYKKRSVVLDRQGDFVRFAVEQLPEALVLVPTPRQALTGREGSSEAFLEVVNKRYCEGSASLFDEMSGGVVCKGRRGKVHFYPMTLMFGELAPRLHELAPYMSEQAADTWPEIYEEIERVLASDLRELPKVQADVTESFIEAFWTSARLRDFVSRGSKVKVRLKPSPALRGGGHHGHLEWGAEEGAVYVDARGALEEAMKSLGLADATKRNVLRNLRILEGTGVFDGLQSLEKPLGGLTEDLLLGNSNVVIDLSMVLEASHTLAGFSVVAYKTLDDVFKIIDKVYKSAPQQLGLTLILIDEAHEFFPQARSETSKETVEAMVNKLMRLGRVRRIGVVLATHAPDDLNPLVLQLANTRVVMRSDSGVARRMGAENFADVLAGALSGLAVVNSVAFRSVLIMGELPG